MINVKPTVEVMENMVKTFESAIQEIERTKKIMIEKDDITYAAEVMTVIRNCFNNLRTDLLVVRPMREYDYELGRLKNRLEEFENGNG